MTTGSRNLVIAAAALVVAALGYFAFGTYTKSEVSKTAMALAQETARHLHKALSTDESRPLTETVETIGEYATVAGRNLEALKRLDAAGNQVLVDAVDDYLLTSREILGKQAASYRFRRQLLASTQALRDHMRADDRTGAWVREAVQWKERVEDDYRNYRGAAEALDKLLESLPASLAKLASRSGATPLVDGKLIADARKRSNAALQQATGEVEKIRQFVMPR